MQRKGWLIPILVFFISIGALLFYQRSNETQSLAATTNLPPILWSKSSSDITKIAFSEFGHEIEVVREGDGWQISKPLSTSGDSLYIYNIISNFAQPTFIETIDTSTSNLIDYGIDISSPTIKLYDTEHEYKIVRGYAANESTYYVYSPLSEMVYTMPKSVFDPIKTDLALWRDKNLLDFQKLEIEKIQLTYEDLSYTIMPHLASDTLSFTSEGLETKPLNSFVNFLETSKVKNFIVDDATDTLFQNYGFSNPTAKISIFLKTGTQLDLVIGKIAKAENLCYVQVNNTYSIVTIPYFNLQELKTIEESSSPDDQDSSGTAQE